MDAEFLKVIDGTRLAATQRLCRTALLDKRNGEGVWEGRLSSSALSTATAVAALESYVKIKGCDFADEIAKLIRKGRLWLAEHQNEDGGWGDTVISRSNISTTVLAWAALATGDEYAAVKAKAGKWITATAGGMELEQVAGAINRRYGTDRTFSAPILSMVAVCGSLGAGRKVWEQVAALPYELALLPRGWFKAVNLRVVSYALPALIAIGQARAEQAPSRYGVWRWVRQRAKKPAMRLLERIQPGNGGFLEATPLTSFVVMNLLAAGYGSCEVVEKGVAFIRASVREDGSWPIDTNLTTWLTTLSVNQWGGNIGEVLSEEERMALVAWLLGQQYRESHPYTGAEPGGWAWTDLPGAVPDADDTAGALLALHHLSEGLEMEQLLRTEIKAAATRGIDWLMSLQNGDGGMPTFCRGWQKLPFDRSGADLTGHALMAVHAWRDQLGEGYIKITEAFMHKSLACLKAAQSKDGAWTPLWFGNQWDANEENPVYGTCRVMAALQELRLSRYDTRPMAARAAKWLVSAQNDDGGWGGNRGVMPSSLEETGLAVAALARQIRLNPAIAAEPICRAVAAGCCWLMDATEAGKRFPAGPIGFYFAKLWYYEELYPNIFVMGAIEECHRLMNEMDLRG